MASNRYSSDISAFTDDQASADEQDSDQGEDQDQDQDNIDTHDHTEESSDTDEDQPEVGVTDNLQDVYYSHHHFNVGDRLDHEQQQQQDQHEHPQQQQQQDYDFHATDSHYQADSNIDDTITIHDHGHHHYGAGATQPSSSDHDIQMEEESQFINANATQTYDRLFRERIPLEELSRPLVYRMFFHAKTKLLLDGYSSMEEFATTIFELHPLTEDNFHQCSQQWTINDIRNSAQKLQKVIHRLGEFMVFFSLAQWDIRMEFSKQTCGLETFQDEDDTPQYPRHQSGVNDQSGRGGARDSSASGGNIAGPVDGLETVSSRSRTGQQNSQRPNRGQRKGNNVDEEQLLKEHCLSYFRRFQNYLHRKYGGDDAVDNHDRPDMTITEHIFTENASILHEMKNNVIFALHWAETIWGATSLYNARVNGQQRRFGQLSKLYEALQPILQSDTTKKRILNLIRYVEHQLFLQNAVRAGAKKDDVYVPVCVPHPDHPHLSVSTPAWEFDKKLDRKVNEIINETETPQFYQVCFPGTQEFSKVIDNLREDDHKPGFQTLKPDRHVFAFQNAVIDVMPSPVERGLNKEYLGKEKPQVHRYGRDPIQQYEDRSATRLIPAFMDMSYVSDYYYERDHLMEIPTPALDTVFLPQIQSFRDHAGLGHEPRTENEKKLHEHEKQRVLFTIYALIGRLFYNIRECDDWQVILEIVGYSNTGKTTLQTLLEQLYAPEYVVQIDCSGNSKWNLGNLPNAYFYSLDETKSETSFNGTTFNHIVDGSPFDCEDKWGDYHQAVRVQGHGIMTGNLPLGISGEGKERRIVPLRFRQNIQKTDTNLHEKLLSELALIVLKCSLAYHYLLEDCANTRLWDDENEVPPTQRKIPYCFYYFAEERSSNMNVLTRFIKDTFNSSASWSVEERKRHAVPFRKCFIPRFREYLQKIQQRSSEAAQMQPDYYRSTFHKLGIHFIDDAHRSDGTFHGERVTDFWLCGIYEPDDEDILPATTNENPASMHGSSHDIVETASVNSNNTGGEISEGRSTTGSMEHRYQDTTEESHSDPSIARSSPHTFDHQSSASSAAGAAASATASSSGEKSWSQSIPEDLLVGHKRSHPWTSSSSSSSSSSSASHAKPSIWPPSASITSSTTTLSSSHQHTKRQKITRSVSQSMLHEPKEDSNEEDNNVYDQTSFGELMGDDD